MTTIKREDDRHEPGMTERVLMVLSVLVVLMLVGYTTYHAVRAPEGARLEATVDRMEEAPDGVIVHLHIKNPAPTGYRSVTVEADCDTPPPQVTIEHVPAADERRAQVLCPPDTAGTTLTVAAAVPT